MTLTAFQFHTGEDTEQRRQIDVASPVCEPYLPALSNPDAVFEAREYLRFEQSRARWLRYYGWPAVLANNECFCAAAALAVLCSNFDCRICISDFRPSTQIALRKSMLP